MSELPLLYPKPQESTRVGLDRPTSILTIQHTLNPFAAEVITGLVETSVRQVLSAKDLNHEDQTVLLIDWPSISTKSGFHQELIQAAQGATICTFNLPGNIEMTPQGGWYLCNYMKVPLLNQAAFIAGYDAYLRGIFNSEIFDPIFHYIVRSREDPEIIVSLQAWPTKELGMEYWDGKINNDFFPAIRDLMTIMDSWGAQLR